MTLEEMRVIYDVGGRRVIYDVEWEEDYVRLG